MVRLLMILFGLAFLVIGVVGIATPIPFGIVFLTLSIVMLVPTVPGAAGAVRSVRRRSRAFDSVMGAVTSRAPMPYRRILRQTEVDDI